jgi:hypothetical protein
MSGIIGHSMYAILGVKAAAHRELPVAPVATRHFPPRSVIDPPVRNCHNSSQ